MVSHYHNRAGDGGCSNDAVCDVGYMARPRSLRVPPGVVAAAVAEAAAPAAPAPTSVSLSLSDSIVSSPLSAPPVQPVLYTQLKVVVGYKMDTGEGIWVLL